MVLHADFSRLACDALGCAELKVTGPEIEAIRNHLAARTKVATERLAAAAA